MKPGESLAASTGAAPLPPLPAEESFETMEASLGAELPASSPPEPVPISPGPKPAAARTGSEVQAMRLTAMAQFGNSLQRIFALRPTQARLQGEHCATLAALRLPGLRRSQSSLL